MSQRVQVEETATKEGLERERGWTDSPYKRRQTHTRSHYIHDTDPENTFLEYHSLKDAWFYCGRLAGGGGCESSGSSGREQPQVVFELAAQILRVAQGPSAFVAGPHKRNSELINSLLGLPKVMNDAGRR
ncbi:pigment dispersing hormone related peptide precursor 79 - penaeid shrimp (Penaeus sp.) [Penaeus vannamei]|uniref:Pigment dispersing hormone related peptide 79-penaeid shrimp (Penaeus sp.) n=1 Tax=Penaeus vannamei TaxID=6689 RepID=A0A3R7SIQ3_PENVA|nr:pigment dispersing hormone related peptide precursor 79 - penaeid shrimp (Penaeus sp.) [Penaeus vannamei]